MSGNHTHRVWRNTDGRSVIEEHRIEGLGHGTPLSTSGPDSCGVAGPYMLEAGISSTREIARFWGLDRGVAVGISSRRAYGRGAEWRRLRVSPPRRAALGLSQRTPSPTRSEAASPAIIEDALRTAGLMR